MNSKSNEMGPHGVLVRLVGPPENPRPFYNIRQPLNVSARRGDKLISPLDALLVINHLNSRSENPIDFVDTNGDGVVIPLDALLIINHLIRNDGGGEGEGEGTSYEADVGESVYTELASLDHFVSKIAIERQRGAGRRM